MYGQPIHTKPTASQFTHQLNKFRWDQPESKGQEKGVSVTGIGVSACMPACLDRKV